MTIQIHYQLNTFQPRPSLKMLTFYCLLGWDVEVCLVLLLVLLLLLFQQEFHATSRSHNSITACKAENASESKRLACFSVQGDQWFFLKWWLWWLLLSWINIHMSCICICIYIYILYNTPGNFLSRIRTHGGSLKAFISLRQICLCTLRDLMLGALISTPVFWRTSVLKMQMKIKWWIMERAT